MVRVNRGKQNLFELAETALRYDADRVIVVNRWRNFNGIIELFKVGSDGLILIQPFLTIIRLRLRRDFGSHFKRIKSLVITKSSTKPEVEQAAESISRFLKVQISSGRDAVSFDAIMDFSSETFSKQNSISIRFFLQPSDQEIGPYMSIRYG
jgi:rRNA maturation protein Rpf1